MARTVQPWVTGQSSAAHFRPCPEASSSGPFPSAVQDLFKGFARHLSHLLAQKLSPGRSGECHLGQGQKALWGSGVGE